MTKEQLEEVIRELYKLWNMNNTEEDIDFILTQVIKEIGKE